MKVPELTAMLFYCVFLLVIGLYCFLNERKRKGSEKEYFLGGRGMNGWVSALSAGASDMSAWILMGLPGAIYLYGVGQVWIAVGLFIGTVSAWIFIAPRLRRYSIAANDSITIPQFLTNRFCTEKKGILIISAIVFVVTYCVYAAASLYACGTLFNTVLGMEPKTAMIIATVVIVVYTFLGGYSAVCWTDFFQGLLMLAALLFVPIMVLLMMNSAEFVKPAAMIPANYWNWFSTGKCDWKSWSDIISGLGWGFGYAGMPHILIRYFSVSSEKEMNKSRIIGCVWFFFILLSACAVGLIGREFIGDSLTTTQDGNTLIFINMVRSVFDWIAGNVGGTVIWVFCAGFLLSAIIAAAMSTADSQLLASSSAFVSDLYKPLVRKNASDKEMMFAGRAIVIVIAIVAFIIASRPECKGLMDLVACAWGAFGAAFGPVIILALYWKRLTYSGALSGIIVGFAVDALWYIFMSKTGIYEIVPGFIAGFAASVIVSLLSKAPEQTVVDTFEKSQKKIENSEVN